MKLIIAIFFTLSGSIGLSKEKDTFSCNQIVYGFINGIDYSDESENKKTARKISVELKIKEVEPIFSQSAGKYNDIKKSIKQKIDEKLEEDAWYDALNRLKLKAFQKILDSKQNNEDVIVVKIKDIKNEEKGALVVFSHSQGNLYANDACGKLGKGSFHNIQIATPADKIKCSDFLSYTSIHSDEMIIAITVAEIASLGLVGLEVNSPLKTNKPQHLLTKGSLVHSMENYLLNPPSLMKIKSDHEDMIKKLNYEKSVVKLKGKEEINCRNIASYVDEKIEINKDQTGLILGKTVKLENYDNIEIEKIDDDTNLYQVSKFNRYAWVATIFQWISVALLLMFLPSILYFMGSIMTTMGDSDKAQREKEQDRYR